MRDFPPFIDLHVHLRGTIEPAMAARFSEVHEVPLPSTLFATDGKGYHWGNFEEFLQVYDSVGRVIRAPDDLYFLTLIYLKRCAIEGTAYVEFMLSPSHSIQNGIPYDQQISSIALAIDEAKERFGIEARLIVTCVRHQGPDEALNLAEQVAEHSHPVVVGFGLTGNELLFDIAEFEGAFMVAAGVGLGLTAHAGEWTNGKAVLHSVDALGLSRIGHGISAATDSNILTELAERGVGFEICISSNIVLGRCTAFEEHPIRTLVEAGCKVSLATDDPAYFRTSPATEYKIAHEKVGLTQSHLQQITMDAINMAFCDQPTKDALIRRASNFGAGN